MEYYDSIGSRMLYTYYMQKNYGLLRSQEIVDILDKNLLDNIEKVDVFKENPYVIVEKKRGTCNYTFKRNTLIDERSLRETVISNILKAVFIIYSENSEEA
jgi:hypothetical protein